MDTTTTKKKEAFHAGLRDAIKMWNAGMTTEGIQEHAGACATGRGMLAACEALLGWLDVAEREARAWL